MTTKEMNKLHKCFYENVKQHLSQYKENNLNISQCGFHKTNLYTHILPDSDIQRNILPSEYHDAIISYISENKIKLHQFFSHLNSSQALCFNLFMPLLTEKKCDIIDPKIIGSQNTAYKFEHIEDNDEYTNFDLFIEQNNQKHFFEVKYTENGFGLGDKNKESLRRKYDLIYLEKIKKFHSLEHDQSTFFEYYQFFRNLFYCLNGYVYFVFPKAREDLYSVVDSLKHKYCPDEYLDKVKIIIIDDLITKINTEIKDKKIIEHYKLFAEKYLIKNTERRI